MGLDTSHNAWHGPYSSFGEWRKWLASKIGMNLNEMEGFGGKKSFNEYQDDLCILLDHSDCDGEISWQDCLKLALRLEELIKDEPDYNEQWSNKDKTNYFIKGCRMAFALKENLEFN